MRYYETDEAPWMTFSRTGLRENEEPHSFLGMDDRHKERMYAISMLLHLWDRYPDAKVYLDGQEVHPTDEEFAEVQERRPTSQGPVIRAGDADMPDALVSASVEVERLLHEEDEPRRASIRATMARVRARKEKVKPCKKGGKGLRAMMAASQP